MAQDGAMTITSDLDSICILQSAINGRRINEEEAIHLFVNADLLDLAVAATAMRNKHNNAKNVSYIIDRNVNYTNICSINCSFCAFCRRYDDCDAYVLNLEQLKLKAEKTKSDGGTGFLIQGGVNTKLPWQYYLDLVSSLSSFGMWIHGFSPVEIQMMAKISGQNLEKTIRDLRDAGLGSIPGGGAEILVERTRKITAPFKGGPEKWLEVMEIAHSLGIKTTATMMFGLIETIAERVEHLRVVRDQQDRALARANGGWHTAFAAWPFQSKNTIWDDKSYKVTDAGYLRTIAVSRIYLDNFPHIQSSWVTMGHKTGQIALGYGCDDMGSLMFEESVVRAAGANYSMTLEKMRHLIIDAGFTPWQRNAVYCPVNQGSFCA